MYRYNRLDTQPDSMLTLYNSAIARYKRQDPIGAADTLRNMAKTINPTVNFYKLEPTEGTIEDAIVAHSVGKIQLTLKILKHIHLELHFSKLAV